MDFFRYEKKKSKPLLTQRNFATHGLYHKIRKVLPYGARGAKKVSAVDDALEIQHSSFKRTPKLTRPLAEDEAEDKIERLARSGQISEGEAERIEKVISEDLHPNER